MRGGVTDERETVCTDSRDPEVRVPLVLTQVFGEIHVVSLSPSPVLGGLRAGDRGSAMAL